MAAIFDTENNDCSQDDYIAPVFGVIDDSGVSKYELRVELTIIMFTIYYFVVF